MITLRPNAPDTDKNSPRIGGVANSRSGRKPRDSAAPYRIIPRLADVAVAVGAWSSKIVHTGVRSLSFAR